MAEMNNLLIPVSVSFFVDFVCGFFVRMMIIMITIYNTQDKHKKPKQLNMTKPN